MCQSTVCTAGAELSTDYIQVTSSVFEIIVLLLISILISLGLGVCLGLQVLEQASLNLIF